MNYEQYLVGTVNGLNSDDYEVEVYDDEYINILRQYNVSKDGIIRYSSAKDAEKYEGLNLKDGVKVKLGLYTEDGNTKIDIIERLQTYERRTLEKYLDVLIKHNKVNHMIPQIMAEKEDQIPIDFGDRDEISTDDIKDFVQEDEVFTDNPNYLSDASNFSVCDNNGNIMFSIESENNMSGVSNRVRFVFPFEHEEDREAFLDFCDRLQSIRAIKYPKE